MANYAVIDRDGNIVNVIVLDDPSAWSPPEGCSVIEDTGQRFAIGGTVVGGEITPPPPPPSPPPPVVVETITPEQLLKAMASKLGLSDMDVRDLLAKAKSL